MTRKASVVVVVLGLLAAGGLLVLLVSRLVVSSSEGTDAARRNRLLALPYLSHSPEQADQELTNVVRYDRDRSYPGYNLYTSRTSPTIILMDMEGNVVHEWTSPQEDETIVEYAAFCGNGDLLVINKFEDLVRVDLRGEEVWRQEIPAHHDVFVEPDDSAWLVIRDIRRMNGLKVSFPAIVRLDPEGHIERSWYAYDHLDEIKTAFDITSLDPEIERAGFLTRADRFFTSIYLRMRGIEEKLRDPFHQNTVTVLPETPLGKRDPRFRAGNLLICYRNLDQIAVYDPDTERFVWSWGQGILDRPHYPVMLESGTILIFDNGSLREYSRVVEIDPATEEIVWEYAADPRESFYTEAGGSAQRLPNGNTLITETMRGRVFEVTPDGEIVWEWFHPVIDDGHRSQVYRMIRYPKEQIESFLR